MELGDRILPLVCLSVSVNRDGQGSCVDAHLGTETSHGEAQIRRDAAAAGASTGVLFGEISTVRLAAVRIPSVCGIVGTEVGPFGQTGLAQDDHALFPELRSYC